MDIHSMTPRQLAAGLIRGNRTEMKLGYAPEAAAIAAARVKEIAPDSDEYHALLAYAQGFADGLVEDAGQAYTSTRESDAVIA